MLGAPIPGGKLRRYGFTLLVTGHGDIDGMLGVHRTTLDPNSNSTNVDHGMLRCHGVWRKYVRRHQPVLNKIQLENLAANQKEYASAADQNCNYGRWLYGKHAVFSVKGYMRRVE